MSPGYAATNQFLQSTHEIRFNTARQLKSYLGTLSFHRKKCPHFNLLTRGFWRKAQSKPEDFTWKFIDEISFKHLNEQMLEYNYQFYQFWQACVAA